MTDPKKYAISWYWRGKRRVFVRRMSYRTALAIGRHLWRFRWLGLSHLQVESHAEGSRTNYALWSNGR